MRCLTLADALSERGVTCSFITRRQPGDLEALIRDRGFEVRVLQEVSPDAISSAMDAGKDEPPHQEWLAGGWELDASETVAALGGGKCDWLIVDHYGIDARWEKQMSGHVGRVMVVDDLADRPHVCDVLLDQNLGRVETDYEALVPNHCVRLIGPGHALLRDEFLQHREYSLARRASSSLGSVLVSLGGVDKDDVTSRVLGALDALSPKPTVSVTVVIGARAPWLEKVRATAERMRMPTTVLCGVSNMAELMANADLAIGAAGGTAWERCCLGLPTLMVTLADNQVPGAKALELAGAAVWLGGPDEAIKRLPAEFKALEAEEALHRLREASAQLCDGAGAHKVCRVLLGAQKLG
ncbi:UDP-2,4-diacetamido-2,4,6-trideoxy-beta-L-altropyranose hydrolase [Marinobacter qingdaonensis]